MQHDSPGSPAPRARASCLLTFGRQGLHGNTALMIACAPTEKLAVLGFLLSCVGVQKDKVNARGMTGDHHTLLDEPAMRAAH